MSFVIENGCSVVGPTCRNHCYLFQ